MKALFIPLMLAALSGCVSQDYVERKEGALELQDEIDTARARSAPLNNVAYLDKPPARPIAIKQDSAPKWLGETVRVKSSGLPLSVVVSRLMQGSGVTVRFDPDIDPNLSVTLDEHATRADILNLLGSLTQYGFTSEKTRLTVGHYQTETFVLTLPAGSVSGQQGALSSSEEGDTTVTGQYLTTQFDEVNIVEQVSEAILGVLKDEESGDDEWIGSVTPVSGLTALTVRTTPSRMAQVRRVVETYQDELSKQVLLDVRVLEFRSNLGRDQGIDWSLVRDIGDGSLNFVIPGTSLLDTGGSSSGLAFQGANGWEGTSAFIRALEMQGSVSTDTPISVLTLSAQPARISQVVKTPYLSDISTEVTDTTTSTSTTRGEVVEGIDLMVSTNVKDDFVWIRTAGKLTKIAGDDTEVINEATLRFIATREADLTFSNSCATAKPW